MDGWILPSAVSGVVLMVALVFVLRRPLDRAVHVPLLLVLVGAIFYACGDIGQIRSTSMGPLQGALWLLYSGVLLYIVASWHLALRFVEFHGQPSGIAHSPWAWLPLVGGASLWLVLLSNPWHGKLFEPVVGAGRSNLGPLFLIHAAFCYGIVVASMVVYARAGWKLRYSAHAWRFAIMLVSMGIGVAAGSIHAFRETPLPFDPAVAGTALSAVMILGGLYGKALLPIGRTAATAVMRHQHDGVLVIDPWQRLVYANPSATLMLGQPVLAPGSDVLGLLTRQLHRTEGTGEAITPTGLLTELEEKTRLGTGRLYRLGTPPSRFVSISLIELPNPLTDRKTERALILHDQTELEQATEALRRSEQTLRLVLDSVPYHVYAKDRSGRYIFMNEAMAHSIGTSAERLLGQDIRSTGIGKDAVERFEDLDRRLFENGEPVLGIEQQVLDGTGRMRIYRVTKLPVELPGMDERAMLGVSVEITDLKRTEEALLHAQKLESLGVMAGGIAHDFNNLLVAVLGNAGVALAEVDESSPAHAALADIEKAARRASDLTRELLAYAGKGRMRVEDIDLSATVRDVTDLIGVSIPKSIQIVYDLAYDLPAVHADASQMRQIVMNLVINASDAIGEGSGTIRVKTSIEQVEAENGDDPEGRPAGLYAVLSVRDDGCGMDTEILERIFDPFFSTKRSGRGLGLAAVQGIVKGHGGFIRVDSAPRAGSEISVYLPSSDRIAQTPAPPTADVETGALTGTILIVDDEPSILRMARRMLERTGMEVLEAEDGLQALEVFARYRDEIDVVLLDMTMPHQSGVETARALRAERPTLPILLSSGYPEANAAASVPGRGPLGFIQKPYAVEDLKAQLAEIMGGR